MFTLKIYLLFCVIWAFWAVYMQKKLYPFSKGLRYWIVWWANFFYAPLKFSKAVWNKNIFPTKKILRKYKMLHSSGYFGNAKAHKDPELLEKYFPSN